MEKEDGIAQEAPDVEDVAEAAAVPSKGRAAFIERYRGYHPDLEEDPDDDTLFDYAGKGLTERDEWQGKYNKLNGSNETFAAAVSKDPRLAQFVAMIGAGENVFFAMGKSFGNILNELDDESLEKLREGQGEYQKRYETIKSNFQGYEERLRAYVEKNQLPAEAAEQINNVILDIAEALNEGDIPEEVIDNVWKGIDHDEARQAEIEAAKLAAKNEAAEDQKRMRSQATALPDLSGTKSQPRSQMPSLPDEEKYTPYADSLEMVSGKK
jgi:hypothetical protein